ncbi:ABC transporter ATP-binding protein [Mycolicibacter arupensis]|uniref:ABC transporter ATP-binding protein n=1 Tax=Mycolicibacter arupensis TaxID=342002 RepID=UPI003B3ABE40
MVTVAVLSLGVTVVIPLMTKAVIDGPVAHRDQPALWALGAAATALGVLEAVLWFVRRWLIAHGTMGVEADIRKDLYARLQILPLTFHGRWQSGQLLSRIMNDLAAVRRFLSFVAVFLVLNALQIIAVSTILMVLYWPLGVVVCLSLIPVMLAVQHFQRQYTLLSRQAQDQAGQVATQVEESAAGLRTIKAFGREDYVFDRFDQQARALRDLGVDKVVVSSKFWTLLEVIPNLTLILVVAGGAYAAGHHLVTLGTLVAFVTLMLSLIWPLSALGFLLSATQEAMTAADRITEIFRAPVEITDGADPLPPSGRLELQEVGFRFTAAAGPDAPWVLRGVNLTVEPGETVALVGATGSGKSVLAMLVSRLYDVSAGQILIGGRDIRSLTLTALRSAVITAFDDPTLFSMSVAENLRLGRPDADDMDLARALDVASANFVYDLPAGLDTRIGEQGMSLSGGQRQRLSLARALVAAPTILVLDDTLSALDVHTEAAVTAALRRVLRDEAAPITTLVVANRASTVALADRVALIEDGTVTAVGTHAELLATMPRYRNLLAADDELDDGAEHLVDWVRR